MIRKKEKTSFGNGLDLPRMREMQRDMASAEDSLWQNIYQPMKSAESTNGVGDSFNRRDFVKLMGASMGLAGMTACTKQPVELIVPYVDAPEEIIPGKPLFFATSMVMQGVANAVLAESHMGRPTKLEPNPEHPGSSDGSHRVIQASIRDMYDPDRSQEVLEVGRSSTWGQFDKFMSGELARFKETGGEGLGILLEPTSSPTMIAQLKAIASAYPKAKVAYYTPVSEESAVAGAEKATGKALTPIYHFDQAKVVVSLDSDFLASGPGNTVYARDFSKMRDLIDGDTMNRLYVFESSYTSTGTAADHRLAVRTNDIGNIAAAIAKGLGLEAVPAELSEQQQKYVTAVVNDLKSHSGASVLIAGTHLPADVQALILSINEKVGGFGKTVDLIEPVVQGVAGQAESFSWLVDSMNEGSMELLFMLDVNPVYTAPSDMNFAEALGKVKTVVHAGEYVDETSMLSHWHVPLAHYLETWEDARTYEGTASIVQPLIAPLYDGRMKIQLLAPFAGNAGQTAHEALIAQWQGEKSAEDFRTFWRTALHDGYIAGTASKPVTASAAGGAGYTFESNEITKGALEINFRPDPNVFDGRYSNNAWLQETARPVSTLTWDNAVVMSPTTANALGLMTGAVQKQTRVFPRMSMVSVTLGENTLEGALLVLPGHANDSITLYFGYGRTQGGEIAKGLGHNAYALRTSDGIHNKLGAVVASTPGVYNLAMTQTQHTMAGRTPARAATFDFFKKDPKFAEKMAHVFDEEKYSLYATVHEKPTDYSVGHQWAMAIDLTRCTSCHACQVACQAENNIAVVGKDEVLLGRELSWIRVDRYFRVNDGDDFKSELLFSDDVQVETMPVGCQHCENAPCETVCPVGATMHSHEGINQMVYNRCVGTRYCSNNCPYKVRRYNYYQYDDRTTESLKGMRNPDVTPRVRGVMEKCSYCIQRVNHARIEAKKDFSRKDDDGMFWIKDGEVKTACQQACPTNAIAFGNLNDPAADTNKRPEILRFRDAAHEYSLLGELMTVPRTTYIARVRNASVDILGKEALLLPPHGYADHSAHGHEEHAPAESHGKDEKASAEKGAH